MGIRASITAGPKAGLRRAVGTVRRWRRELAPGKTRFLFLHVPKSAGTTVWRLFFQTHAKGRIFLVGTGDQMKRFCVMTPDEADRFDVLGGHATADLLLSKLKSPHRYYAFCVIRDPVDRVVSSYNYIRSRKDHWAHGIVAPMSIEDYAAYEQPDLACYYASNGGGFRESLDVLSGFDLVVTQKDADRLLHVLQARLGLPPATPRRANVAKGGLRVRDLSPATHRRIEARNAEDRRLFDHVLRLGALGRDAPSVTGLPRSRAPLHLPGLAAGRAA